MTAGANDFTGPTVELLQSLIRNECVNDGTPDSGFEGRNADLLQTYLEGSGLAVERFDSRPGRTSMVARIEGSDPAAPALCLMGHTDVVPANPDGWSRDPFAGELVDGEVWGRGAIDMLNITSSMAVAFRQLADEGFRPKGTLIYFGVADEEAGGQWGAEFMLDEHWDAVGADYVLTESGGWSQGSHDGTRAITINVAEKGIAWRRLRVSGTPGHGSMPYGSDNALITAAEIVRRLATYRTRPYLDDLWQARLATLDIPADVRTALSDPATIDDGIASLPPEYARVAHACSHTTISPNVIHGGQKTNTIPDVIDIDVDMRTVPGDTKEVVDDYLADALGELADRVTISSLQEGDATRSPIDNPLWEALATNAQVAYPGAELVPGIIVGGTDARFYRLKGSIAYGAGLFSPSVTMESFGNRFHGNDERIDVESLGLSAQFWYGIAKQLVG
ncbi:MAG: M20/M25/M40 family metallo-hydrolase [Acidimicrobiia bacterium]|nr:M20/M25/M40 family metallo-hydrolase [Acidimicrobiia bacterium]